MATSPRTHIVDLLFAAGSELQKDRSEDLLRQAATAAREWARQGGGTISCVLGGNALCERAQNSTDPRQRSELWKAALSALDWTDPTDIATHAENGAAMCVDIFQDRLADFDFNERQRFLRLAKNRLDEALSTTPSEFSLLLARKSSVLRYQSLELGPGERLRLLQEAHRCANRAVEEASEPANVLELALAEWALARHEKSDEHYTERIDRAEEIFHRTELRLFDTAQFSLAHFYRMTFRPLDACLAFPKLTYDTLNRRRLLRQSTTYAEAAISLRLGDYPEEVCGLHLSEARHLLEATMAAGFKSARTVVALAFVKAIVDGPDAGLTALEDICNERGELSWNQVLEIISRAGDRDLPASGLALGILDSGVISRLGSFVNRFLDAPPITESLYRAAVSTNPRNAVALTNLARYLVTRGQPRDLREAKSLLGRASNFADRRFRWWREVQQDLKILEQGKPPNKAPVYDLPNTNNFSTLAEVRRHYHQVQRLENRPRRGYALEELLYHLARLTAGMTAKPAYRFQRGHAMENQVDFYLEHRGEKYRCECKWQEIPCSYNDIRDLKDKIDVAGISGLLVSMSGFRESAIEKAREVRGEVAILLMDGDEVGMVMNGLANFDEILTKKRSYLDQRSEPYFPVHTAKALGH